MQTKNGKLFNKGVISATAGSWDRTAGLIEMVVSSKELILITTSAITTHQRMAGVIIHHLT